MSNHINTAPAATGWQHLDQPTTGPADTLHASIHPGGQLVTLNYRGGDPLVLDVTHFDALASLLAQVKAATK
ncbi:hypothetical protein [Arthrobacter rhombi]|uniref:hypothetical protein n=1 Tax=Arthrobacter rhombi TaxID=71253 RepID=UPI003FD61BE1